MVITKKYASPLSILAILSVVSCAKGEKKEEDRAPGEQDPAKGETSQDSATKSALADQLQADLVAYGLTAEQASSLVAAGKAASSSAALLDEALPASAETLEFNSLVMAKIIELGLDPAQLPLLGGVVAGSSDKVTLASLGADQMTAAEAAPLIGDIAGDVVKVLDQIGMDATKLPEAVDAVSKQTSNAVASAEASVEFQSDAMSAAVNSVVASLSEAGAGKDQIATYVGKVNETFMDAVMNSKAMHDHAKDLGPSFAEASITGADSLPDFTDVSSLVEQTSKGLIKSLLKDPGLQDSAKLEAVAGPIAAQVFESSSKFQGVDFAKLSDVTKAMNAGIVGGAEGKATAIFTMLAEVGTAEAIKGAGAHPGFDQAQFATLVSAGAEGAMNGGKAAAGFTDFGKLAESATSSAIESSVLLTKFDVATMSAFAGNITSAILKGSPSDGDFAAIAQSASQQIMTTIATKVPTFDTANLNDLANKLTTGAIAGLSTHAGLDPAKITAVGSSAATGVVTGAGAFASVDSTKLAEIGTHATTGVVNSVAANLPSQQVNATDLQNSTQAAANSSSSVAQVLQACLAVQGNVWDTVKKECVSPAAASSTTTPGNSTPTGPTAAEQAQMTACANSSGVWMADTKSCDYSAAMAACTNSGGTYNASNHSCAAASGGSSTYVMKPCAQFVALQQTARDAYKGQYLAAKNTNPTLKFCSRDAAVLCSTFAGPAPMLEDGPGFCKLP